MEESKKTWNDQEKKKIVIKMGGRGGGIGAVVLLGGALATAALASAFIVRKKGRSSSKDRRRRHQNPPPEINKQNEQDEANKGQQCIFLDQPSHLYKHTSSGATKEVESDNDTAFLASTPSSTRDENPRVEINGGIPGDVCDVEASEQILCSISPKKPEDDAISDGYVIIEEDFPLLDEKLPSEPQNMMHEDEVKIELTKEDVSNEISKESKNLEQGYIEEERAEREPSDDGAIEVTSHKEAVEITEKQPRQEENTEVCYDQEETEVALVDKAVEGVHIDQTEAQKNVNMKENMEKKELEGFCGDNGEISEEKCVEAIERTKLDLTAICLELSEDGYSSNQEAISTDSPLSEIIVSESQSADGQKTLLPVFDSLVIEHENVNCDEREGALPTEIVEIIQEDEAIEGSQEDQVKYIEEQMVKGQEKCDQPEEGNVPETCEEVGWTGEASQSHLLSDPTEVKEDKIPCESTEENACIVHPTPENRQFDLPMLKEELISPDDIEVTKEDGANEDKTSMQFVICQPKDHEDDAKKNIAKEVEDELISPEDIEVTKEDGANKEVAESLEVNENKSSMQFVICQPEDHEDDAKKNIAKEVEEELISREDIEVTKEDGANVEVAEGLVLNENKTSMQFVICQPEDHEDDAKKNIAKEVEEELICPEDIEVTKEDGANVEVAEGLVLNENKTSMQFAVCQPKDHEDDLERNIEKEVEEELICPENIEVTKEDVTNEEVDESAEVTGNKTSLEFVVGQPIQREDSVETNIVGEVEDSSETTDTGIATAKDDSIMEMSEDEEKGEDNIKDFIDETALSDEVEEISVGTGDSSMESNSEAVWPAESLQESSM